jgi:hypothetical protein
MHMLFIHKPDTCHSASEPLLIFWRKDLVKHLIGIKIDAQEINMMPEK